MKSIKYLLPLFLLTFPLLLSAQSNQHSSSTSLRLGVGKAFLGNGDNRVIELKNEILHKWSRHFSNSLSLNYGSSYNDYVWSTTIAHADLSLLYSPFGNDRLVDFKIGGGVSYMYEHSTGFSTWITKDNQTYFTDFWERKDHQIGGIVLIGADVQVWEKYTFGLEGSIQPYTNNTMSAWSLNFGMDL